MILTLHVCVVIAVVRGVIAVMGVVEDVLVDASNACSNCSSGRCACKKAFFSVCVQKEKTRSGALTMEKVLRRSLDLSQ